MSLAMVTKPLLSATGLYSVLIEGLYSGMCTVPEKSKGGRGVSVLHEGDTH